MFDADALSAKKDALDATLNEIDTMYTTKKTTSNLPKKKNPLQTGNQTRATTTSAAASATTSKNKPYYNDDPYGYYGANGRPKTYANNGINFDPFSYTPNIAPPSAEKATSNVYLQLPGGEEVGPMAADGKVVGNLKKAVARESLKSGRRSCG